MNTRTVPGRLTELASLHAPARPRSTSRGAAALLTRLAGAALLVWIGYIHLHLWQEGYRFIPTNGPFFLLDAIVAVALAALLSLWPRPLIGVLAAGFTASTIGALVISLTIGLFGFHESITASFVVLSLVIETLAVILLATWTALVSSRPSPA
ncbi:MAG: hypothetical protein ACLQFR_25275 [Streptosporangiaceae bacterium]